MKKEVKTVTKKRKLNVQKIFNLISAMFLLACIIFYGTRFIKLYLENNKTEETKTFADNIKDNNLNNENLKNVNGTYYFNGDEENNYLEYSNITFRIIKINKDNTVTAVTNDPIATLAKGEKDYINTWLNKSNTSNSGILENNLNDPSKYLTFTKTCNDKVNDTKTISCDKIVEDTYITVPSIYDYVNTGGQKGFMNNEKYFYLINENKENKTWYIDNTGKVNTSDNTDILGIKAVITIKNTISLKNGDGSKENPYTIEESNGLLGSYVKLDNDVWRIYKVEEEYVKLSLDGYAKINGEETKYKYSTNGYYHNDGAANTLAYYLKNKYLNSLSYKDKIEETNFSNGTYSTKIDFDYTKTLTTTVPTKIALLSIGDIILNSENTNYYTSTGLEKDSNLVYVMENDYKVYTKLSTTSLKIVPVISIKKDLLEGSGTKESPYEVK